MLNSASLMDLECKYEKYKSIKLFYNRVQVNRILTTDMQVYPAKDNILDHKEKKKTESIAMTLSVSRLF